MKELTVRGLVLGALITTVLAVGRIPTTSTSSPVLIRPRWLILPSLPTTFESRSNSCVKRRPALTPEFLKRPAQWGALR